MQTDSYVFLDVLLNLRDCGNAVLTKLYFQGSIESTLTAIFGEIGGQTELEVTEFDAVQRRAIVKVPENQLQKTRIAITLIGHFQNIPCHFHVLRTSKDSLNLNT